MAVVPLFLMCDAADVDCEHVRPYHNRPRPHRILVFDRRPGGVGVSDAMFGCHRCVPLLLVTHSTFLCMYSCLFSGNGTKLRGIEMNGNERNEVNKNQPHEPLCILCQPPPRFHPVDRLCIDDNIPVRVPILFSTIQVEVDIVKSRFEKDVCDRNSNASFGFPLPPSRRPSRLSYTLRSI